MEKAISSLTVFSQICLSADSAEVATDYHAAQYPSGVVQSTRGTKVRNYA
jgi:hypothetical protein